ncbi:hypothetical protein ABPG75_004726 [Micractinium tetrahymenae]
MPSRPGTRSGLKAAAPKAAPPAAGSARGSVAAADADAAVAGGDGADSNIRVVLRVRPPIKRELAKGDGTCVQVLGSQAVRVAPQLSSAAAAPAAGGTEPHMFSFDHVAGESADQECIFQEAGSLIVDNCLAGYNGCIFAYGQTGSGKTFTMMGTEEGGGAGGRADASRGLIQRVFEDLFGRLAKGRGAKYVLECSFLEIYNETINDLIEPSRSNLQVRESAEGPFVPGLSIHAVQRVEDVVALLRTGQANRRVAETNTNERSSRSHSVFTCWLQSKTVDASGSPTTRRARLHLVDLAGSERQKASGAQGERLKEATAINSSLSVLGNVIMRLADRQQGRARHIPYRDSRLTYLLQDSLGGNSKTCLVANVSPAPVNLGETLSTLRFADQAKRIRSQAVLNEDTDDRDALRREIKRLKGELSAARQQAGQGHPQFIVRRFCCCFLPVRQRTQQVHPSSSAAGPGSTPA